jgi:hypothetical protein
LTSDSLRRRSAIRPVVLESLEQRRLLAGDFNAGVALPYQLDFNRSKTGILDRDGSGTGFTWVQPNNLANEYSPAKINLKIGVGLIRMYATDDNANTTNLNGTNNLENVLTTRFAASSKAFVISTRINGPWPQLTDATQQGGIIFGPDQDNYVKLTLGSNGSSVGLQFLDEQKFKTGYKHSLSSNLTNIGSLSAVSTLDLYLSCDPATGIVRALYRINSGAVIELPQQLTLKDDKRAAFFSNAGFAGLMVQNDNTGHGIEMAFDQFGLKRGVLNGSTSSSNGTISVPSRKIFNDVKGGSGQSVSTSITNTGGGDLHISGISVGGTDASQFSISNSTSLPTTLSPGESLPITLTFSAGSSTAVGIKTANVIISSDDPSTPQKNIRLRGLATAGLGGTNEPSLQRIMDLYEIPINVGDSNPNDVFLDDPPAQPNDEVDLQRMVKAGSGPVTIQPLASFGVGSSTSPTVEFGYYHSGTSADLTQLLSLQGTGAATQTVSPAVVGSTSFATSDIFSLYMKFPSMYPTVVSTPGGTIGYGEDILNKTYDAHSPRKIRFYPYKDSSGNVVPNTYVFTGEDLNAAYDTQDFVGVISNVAPAASGAKIGFINGNGAPFGDRMVFNRLTTPDPNFPNVVHDTGNIIVTNTGTTTLNVTGITLPSQWTLTGGSTSFSLAPGGTKKLTLKFTGSASTGNKLFEGNMVISSNDTQSPTTNVQLEGFWQQKSENNQEPTLPQMVQMFGYQTTIVGAGQNLADGGKVEAVGDEVLSPFWKRADSSAPVTVVQLAAFHTEGNTAVFKWYPQGSSSRNVLFTTDGNNAQSFFPLQVSSGAVSAGSFNPTTAFALKVDGEGSDDSSNIQEQPGGGFGHHVRFWPVKDRSGNVVPNTYLMGIDYSAINYDYNDNVYLITNMKPAAASGALPSATSQFVSALPPATAASTSFGASAISASTLMDSVDKKDLIGL